MTVTLIHTDVHIAVRGTTNERKALAPNVSPLFRFDYLIGEMQPNYPLPARSIVTYFWPDLVVQFDITGKPKRTISTLTKD